MSDEWQRLVARVAIEELNARFAQCLDEADYDGLPALFTADARYVSGARELHGGEGVRAFFAERARLGARTTRHLGTSLQLRFEGTCSARGHSVWLSFACNEPAPVAKVTPFMVADFDDLYVRGDDGAWRLHERRITPAFHEPALVGRK